MKLLTVDELAERLKCTPAAVRRLCASRQVSFLPFKSKLFSEEDVVAVFGQSPLLTPAEAAERLNISEKELRALRDNHKLPSFNLGRIRFRDEDVHAFLDWQRAAPERDRASDEYAAELEAARAARLAARRGVKRLKVAPSGVFYVHWTEGRRSKRVSTGTRDPRQAERFLRDLL